jgi:hypothetical protein
METVVQNVRKNNPLRRFGFNVLIYTVTLVIVFVFVYFIYKYISGGVQTATSLILKDQVNAASSTSSKLNVRIPEIYDGGEFTINFWIYISGYNYRSNERKHILEIYSANGTAGHSTLLIALDAFSPKLLVRAHTKDSGSLDSSGNYGITDCSGESVGSGLNSDCSGTKLNFYELTDKNYNITQNMTDNSLTISDLQNFFKALTITQPTSTCEVPDLPMQKWINICVVMNARTLDIYLDGKLVKTCIYKHYFKVDNANGVALRYLQSGTYVGSGGGATPQTGFDGYFSRLQMFNSALTPDDIYKTYMSGPTGSTAANDPLSFIKYLFTG